MKLIGNLKKQVEKAETKDAKKSLIEKAGILLTDDELEQVSGGGFYYGDSGSGTWDFDNDNSFIGNHK